MSVCAIVPFRSFSGGKRRLAGVLQEAERVQLNRLLLTHVLQVVRDCPDIDRSLVVSPDQDALALAGKLGVESLLEEGEPDLNSALRYAAETARAASANALLVIAADLPALQVADITAFIERDEGGGPVVLIAPDRHERGTNLLYQRPLDAIPFCFGSDSYSEHSQAARQRGISIAEYRSHGAGFDLDQPADLALYRQTDMPDRIAEA